MKSDTKKVPGKKTHRATTVEAREDQLISLAINLAEEKLRDGTASNAMIIHYLKLGSTKEKLEKDILSAQKELYEAKTDALKSAKKVEELYASALDAMRSYSGRGDNNDEEEDVY